jgi:GTPase SAR1 family protein
VSFESIAHWIEEINKRADRNIVLAIVGNKCDLSDEREVT